MSVYFIQELDEGGLWIDDNKPIKIGFSVDIEQRLLTLQTGSSVRLAIKACINWGDRELEKLIHDRYQYLRLQGEWFCLDSDLNRFIAHHVYTNSNRKQIIEYLQTQTMDSITKDLLNAVNEYESRSGFRLNISKTNSNFRSMKFWEIPANWLFFRYCDLMYFSRWLIKRFILKLWVYVIALTIGINLIFDYCQEKDL